MSQETFKAKAYLKADCPYSFKYLLFMAEAGLLDRIEVILCRPETAEYATVKATLAAATSKPAMFPTVEIEPGRYMSDSNQLIVHYSRAGNVAAKDLPALSFYREGIFPQLVELHKQDHSH